MGSPTEALVRWMVDAAAPGSTVLAVRGLRGGSAPWLVTLQTSAGVTTVVVRTGDPGDVMDRGRCATEAAALTLAHDRHLPTPRVLAADLDGREAGEIAVVISFLAGSSRIPRRAAPGQLRALGAAAGIIHRVELTPSANLPLRHRPIEKYDFGSARGAEDVSKLLNDAQSALVERTSPSGPTVLVHGDFWQGNTLWLDGGLVGIIDWDCAGVGNPGLDLGSLRLDAAILYGPTAPVDVLAGWQEGAGRPAEAVPYWDLVAGLSTPDDMEAWVPAIHEEGRTDLGAGLLRERRDAFLRAALDRL